jgi:hypothetical protein
MYSPLCFEMIAGDVIGERIQNAECQRLANAIVDAHSIATISRAKRLPLLVGKSLQALAARGQQQCRHPQVWGRIKPV